MNIPDVVRKILSEQLCRSFNEITPDKHLHDDLNGDELDRLEAIMTIEEELKVVLPDEEWCEFETVGQLIAIVERALAAKQQGAAA